VCGISVAQLLPDEQVRFCYECSGFQCLQNPHDPSLFPGRVRCHPVMDFCTSHIRYTPSNHSLGLLPVVTYRPNVTFNVCSKYVDNTGDSRGAWAIVDL